MHFGILAEVDRRQMEAEDLDAAQQTAQPAAGQAGAAVQFQRIGQHLEVGAQGIRRGIGFGAADLVTQRLDLVEGAGGRGETGVDAGQGAAVGLVGALRRVVGRVFGQGQQFRRDLDQQVGERQFAAQFVDFGEIVVERGGRLQAQRFAQDLGGDEGVAVAVAADPAADAKEGRQRPGFFRVALVQLLRDLDVEARQLGEEGFLEVGDAVLDLVEHLEAHRAQHPRLPQGQDGVGQRQVVVGRFIRRHPQAFALVEQAGNVAVIADQALALDFGRVGGEHRGDQGVGEEIGDGIRRDGCGSQRIEGKNQAAFARRRAGQVVSAAPADVVLVLGDVGQLQEVAEGADDGLGGVARQRVEQAGQFIAGGRIAVAGEAYGGLSDALDNLKDCLAFLFADRIAEDAAEQADVVAEGFVLVAVERGLMH